MTVVDPVTWRDTGRIEITGGGIDNDIDGLRQSADIDCVNYPEMVERWIRVYLAAKQTGSSERVALFTGLAIAPEITHNAAKTETNLQCYSVLKPADDIYLQRGWYVAAGSNGAEQIKALLSVCPAPVVIGEGEAYLSTAIIAEDEETHLTMVEKILNAINWDMWIEGNGTIHVEPPNTEILATFDPFEFDVIETEIKSETDWFDCPNVFMAVKDEVVGIARDESASSPLSITSRGREIWKKEDDVVLASNQTISEYAMLRLRQEQIASRTLSYDRRYVPNIYPGCRIRMHYARQGFDGIYIVSSNSIDLGYGGRTSEEVMEVLS